MTEMHDVVEMLLTRMKDYPEDFVASPEHAYVFNTNRNKWERALDIAKSVAAPHEKEALDIRFEEAKRAVYMGAALKTIMNDEEPETSSIQFHSGGQEKYRIDANGNMGLGINTMPNTLANTAQNSDISRAILAQQNAFSTYTRSDGSVLK